MNQAKDKRKNNRETIYLPVMVDSSNDENKDMNKFAFRKVCIPTCLLLTASLLFFCCSFVQQERQFIHTKGKWLDSSHSSSWTQHYYHRTLLVLSKKDHALFPLDASDYLGFTLASLGLLVAAGGGIGGGGILVPIFILILGFSPKHAIPLSNITVLGGSIANTFLNSYKRHPLRDRPLIDWDLILVMEPLTIAGALGGVLVNKIMPEEQLVFLLVVFLSVTAYTTMKKAFQMYRKETTMIKLQSQSHLSRIIHEQEEEDDEEERDSLLVVENTTNHSTQNKYGSESLTLLKADSENDSLRNYSADKNNDKVQDQRSVTNNKSDATRTSFEMELKQDTQPNVDTSGTVSETQEELFKILQEEKVVPVTNVKILLILFVVVLFINVMKGANAFPSPFGIQCGSTSFWIANILILLWIFYISFLSRLYLTSRYEAKRRCGYTYVEGDIQWSQRATIVYPLICCLAGLLSGMFGIGGGIIFGPLMLAMGVLPEVISATSACMILFTSFTASTSYAVFGLLVVDYAILCFLTGLISTFVGQIVLSMLMKNSQRKSYIAFIIAGVVLLSAFLMTIQSLISMAEGYHKSTNGICG